MNNYIVAILLLFSEAIFAQTKIDSLEMQNLHLDKELFEQSQQIEKLKDQLNQQNNIADTAGKVIDWSAMIFSLFVIILGFAGWFAGSKFAKIDELKKELEDLLKEFKGQLDKEQKAIVELKQDFEKDKELSFKLLFPIIEGQWFSYQGDSEKAIHRFKEVQQLIPEHPIVINRLNKLLIDSGKLDEAISNLEKFTLKFPDNTKVKYRLAQAYRRNRQLDNAESVIKDVAFSKNNASALYEYGTIKLLKQDFKDAEDALIKSNRAYIAESGTPRDWVFVNLALSQFLQNKTDLADINIRKSIEILKEKLERIPKHPNVNGSLGFALVIEQTNLIEANNLLKKSLLLGLPIMIACSFRDRLLLFQTLKKEDKKINDILNMLNVYIQSESQKIKEVESDQ